MSLAAGAQPLNALLGQRLGQQVDAAEQRLAAQGVGHGHIVAWLAWNTLEMVALLLACERVGAVLLPLNWRLAAAELAHILTHAGAGHLLHGAELEGLAQQVRPQVTFKPGPADGVEVGDVMLVYTSGTTGQPKGALHTSAGMAANIAAALAVQPMAPGDRVLGMLPMFHVGGLCIQVLPALAAGAELLLHPRFTPDGFFDELTRWRPTTTLMVPAVMRAVVEHPRWQQADLSALAYVNCGSQVVPRALIGSFHQRGVAVSQVYGSTESGPVSIALPPDRARSHAGQVGWPAPGVSVQLAPDGEVLLRAPNLLRCYHRHATPAFDAQGWFHTGDLAVVHADGAYEIVGRGKDLIISGGENIHPAEIENVVLEDTAVADCAVVGMADARWGEVPVLVVQMQPGRTLDRAALQARLGERLARFKHPQRVVELADLPRTALGKVPRQQLAQLVQGVAP